MKKLIGTLILFGHIAVCTFAQKPEYAPLPAWYNDYDVKFYKIDIEADNKSADIRGEVEIMAEMLQSGLETFILDLSSTVSVDSVWANGSRAAFRLAGDELSVHIPATGRGHMCTVSVFYRAGPDQDDGFFTAVSSGKDLRWDIDATWTLSEPYNAKRWFPCKQYLPDKADSAHIFVTVPQHLKAGAPGVLSAVTLMPGNKHRYEWKTRYPVAYYLLSFTVSDYVEYSIYAHPEGISDSVQIQNYIYNRPQYLQKNRKVIDQTAALIELFSDIYIPYPFAGEKYGHCVAPMGGGMEHQTMTTLSEFNFLLVAHELAHQWFGNLVTCASFQDIWINEGFASYSEYLALERLPGWGDAAEWMKNAHWVASFETGSIFVPREEAFSNWRIFNSGLTYKKGAALVHYIRYMINNDRLFFDILRDFLTQYQYAAATGLDFKAFLEKKTGIDFTQCFNQWYFGEGFPVFDIAWTTRNDRQLDVLIRQTGKSVRNPLFITDLDILLKRKSRPDTLLRLPVRSERELFSIRVSGEVSGLVIDPGYYVLKEIRSNRYLSDLPTEDHFMVCNGQVGGKQNLTVRFTEPVAGTCTVTLTDPMGKPVFARRTVRRKSKTEISMRKRPVGTYILSVEYAGNRYVRKVEKMAG